MSAFERILVALGVVGALLLGNAEAAENFNGSTDYAHTPSAIIATLPLTQSAMFNSDSATASQVATSIARRDSAINNDGWAVFLSGDQANDPIRALSTQILGNNFAVSTAGYTVGTWGVATGVFASTTSRDGCFNGANCGSNTNSSNPGTQNGTSIGGVFVNNAAVAFADARLAEVAYWSAPLNIRQVGSLGQKFAPICVARADIVAYYAMINDTITLKDSYGVATNLTLSGTPSVAPHPPVIRCDE